MMYFEDMLEKYGFGDGESEPNAVRLYRQVYVEVINRYAEAERSKIRLIAFDRSGMHNSCMILPIPAKMVKGFKPRLLSKGEWDGGVKIPENYPWDTPPEFDEAMNLAIAQAIDEDIDDYVVHGPARIYWPRKSRKK